jgi:hypothetical protein
MGGLSLMPTAKAGMVSVDGSTMPPASPAPACSKVRRDTDVLYSRDMFDSFLLDERFSMLFRVVSRL